MANSGGGRVFEGDGPQDQMIVICPGQRVAREDFLVDFPRPLQDPGCGGADRRVGPAVQRDPHRSPRPRVAVGEPVAGVQQRACDPRPRRRGKLRILVGVSLRQQHLDRFQAQRAQAGHHIACARQERLNGQQRPEVRLGQHDLKERNLGRPRPRIRRSLRVVHAPQPARGALHRRGEPAHCR